MPKQMGGHEREYESGGRNLGGLQPTIFNRNGLPVDTLITWSANIDRPFSAGGGHPPAGSQPLPAAPEHRRYQS